MARSSLSTARRTFAASVSVGSIEYVNGCREWVACDITELALLSANRIVKTGYMCLTGAAVRLKCP